MTGTVLVTGGAGSMGRLATGRLRAAGFRVRVFDLPSVDYAGLEGEPDVEVVRGDLTNDADAASAVANIDAVLHLAAILPPVAERDRELTFGVNVGGTRTLLAAAAELSPDARFVFSSSVSVYGCAAADDSAITVEQALAPDDLYAESKAESERLVRESSLPWVVLRISGVAVPAFQAPPDEWPFTADQRIEFVHRDDAVTALAAAVTAPDAVGRVLNIAGGASWRMSGKRYVEDYCRLVGLDVSEAVYRPSPGHFGWYDTSAGEAALSYQGTPYESYLEQVQAAIDRLLAE